MPLPRDRHPHRAPADRGHAPGGTLPPGDTPARAPGIAVATAGPPLLDALARLAGLLDTPQDVRILAPLYRREVLWRLLTGPQGAVVRQIGQADGNLSPITRTVQWIRDHHDGTIRIGQLASLAQMSESTFHRHFRAPPGRDAQRIRAAAGLPVP